MRLWAPVATGRIVRIELKPQVCGAGAKSRPLTAVLVPVFDKLALFPEATVALGVTLGEGDRSEFGIRVSRRRECVCNTFM